MRCESTSRLEPASNGRRRVSSSYRITPTPHTSAGAPYGLPQAISGEMYSGVPQYEVAKSMPGESRVAKPKSPNLISSEAERKTLRDLTSRWSTARACTCSSAEASCVVQRTTRPLAKAAPACCPRLPACMLILRASVSPAACSVMMFSVSPTWKEPRYEMMLGCDIWCSTQTSRSSCCSFAELRQSTRTRLHTTHCPVHGSRSSTALPW